MPRLLTFAVCAYSFFSLAAVSVGQSIGVKGSDTLGDKMVPKLVEAYLAAGNSTEFAIEAEGSSSAFKALMDGSAMIGMSSRPIKDSEREQLSAAGMEVVEHVAAVDMIAVVVNKSNPLESLSLANLKKVFTSEEQTWKAIGDDTNVEIKVYTRNESSGTFKVFQQLAMEGDDYGQSVMKMEGNSQIAEGVAADAGGIGYVGLSYADAEGVRSIKIEGVPATPENANDYPLSRKLYYYTIEGKVSPECQKFLDWAMTSEEAAKIIAEVGFIPAK